MTVHRYGVDQTIHFKARAKIIAQKATSTETSEFRPKTPCPVFNKLHLDALKITQDVKELGMQVYSQRRNYMSVNHPVSLMSDSDRDRFDVDSQKVSAVVLINKSTLRSLPQALQHLKSFVEKFQNDVLIEKSSLSTERFDHLLTVGKALKERVEEIRGIVVYMMILRKRSVVAKQGTSLSALLKSAEAKMKGEKRSSDVGSSREELHRKEGGALEDDCLRRRVRGIARHSPPLVRREVRDADDVVAQEAISSIRRGSAGRVEDSSDDEDPSSVVPERMHAQLMKENEKMAEKFEQDDSQMTSLEIQMAEIQRLQETLVEKVLDQEKDIEVIHTTAVETTDNLVDANEWIRQAISNSAGRRVVVLFCIIVITFTLIFLDWYNP